MTPETERTCHYFWAFVRNYNLDDQRITTLIREGVSGVFGEDEVVLAAQQQGVDDHPDKEFYNLNIDAGAMWARRLIDRMMAAEDPDARYAESAAESESQDVGSATRVEATEADAERLGVAPRVGHGRWALRAGAGPRRPRRRLRRAHDRDRAARAAHARIRPAPTSTSPCAIDDLPDIRSYSLVGERPVDGAYRVAVKEVEESRGGSLFVRALERDADVEVSEPRSHFELQYGRPEYLLVAGGIGITPLYGMAHALERHGRPFRVLYAARTPEQMPFVDELSELLGDRLERFVSSEGRRLDLDREIERLHPDGELYLCGPLRLRDAAQHAWQAAGRRPDRLQFETFASGGRFAPEAFTVPGPRPRRRDRRCARTARCSTRSRTRAWR